MTVRSGDAWAGFDAGSIPTKSDLSILDRWLSRTGVSRARVLDLGCGVGDVSHRLSARGFSVVGVDINEAALDRAREKAGEVAFYQRDVASPGGLGLEEAPFDVVVCQLVLSIVGGPDERRNLLRNAREALASGGWLYLSASGASGDINAAYARLYEEDYRRTGERRTYFSRDAEGNVLYPTHHFTEEELRRLLETSGFEIVEMEKKKEASSRRPCEPAYFFYAFCRKPTASSFRR